MSRYFVPNRKNRPRAQKEPMWTHIEGKTEAQKTLSDGRPLITERAYIESFLIRYYYFDSTGLEQANISDLRLLLSASGYHWEDKDKFGTIRTYAKLIEDAQRRSIWEVQVVYPTDD